MKIDSWNKFDQNRLPDPEAAATNRGRILRGYRLAAGLNALLLTAARGETIKYHEFDRTIHSTSRWEKNHVLKIITTICVKNNWPILTSLVHSDQDQVPSEGFVNTLKTLGVTELDPNYHINQCYQTDLPDTGSVYLQLLNWRLGTLGE